MLRRFWRSSFAFIALVLALAAPARADSVFLKLGDIRGESTAAGHAGEIDVQAWSWGATNPATVATGSTGVSTGKVSVADLTLQKALDAASPKLFELVTIGTHTPTAILTARRDSDGLEYLKITLTDVVVSTQQLSGSSERPSESVGLSFAKVLVQYRSGPTATWITASWDLTKMAP
jgi:type VI secretion system secreted protein Hcp